MLFDRLLYYFNPRSLAGAIVAFTVTVWLPLFQSTLPRGSDDTCGDHYDFAAISIHAPSRERAVTFESARYVAISIHAPSRERPSRLKLKMLRLPFQSTLPRGSEI